MSLKGQELRVTQKGVALPASLLTDHVLTQAHRRVICLKGFISDPQGASLGSAAFDLNAQELERLRQRLTGGGAHNSTQGSTWRPYPPLCASAWKRDGSRRLKHKLHYLDALVYEALGSLIAEELREGYQTHRQSAENAREKPSFEVLSHALPDLELTSSPSNHPQHGRRGALREELMEESTRRVERAHHLFRHYYQGWTRFTDLAAREGREGAHLLKFDLKSCFRHISHERLLSHLLEMGVSEEHLTPLSALFVVFGEGEGLPEDSPTSHLLAELYLTPLDHALKALSERPDVLKVARYMDDISLIIEPTLTHAEVTRALTPTLTRLNLSLNQEKTKRLTLPSAPLQDPQPDEEDKGHKGRKAPQPTEAERAEEVLTLARAHPLPPTNTLGDEERLQPHLALLMCTRERLIVTARSMFSKAKSLAREALLKKHPHLKDPELLSEETRDALRDDPLHLLLKTSSKTRSKTSPPAPLPVELARESLPLLLSHIYLSAHLTTRIGCPYGVELPQANPRAWGVRADNLNRRYLNLHAEVSRAAASAFIERAPLTPEERAQWEADLALVTRVYEELSFSDLISQAETAYQEAAFGPFEGQKKRRLHPQADDRLLDRALGAPLAPTPALADQLIEALQAERCGALTDSFVGWLLMSLMLHYPHVHLRALKLSPFDKLHASPHLRCELAWAVLQASEGSPHQRALLYDALITLPPPSARVCKAHHTPLTLLSDQIEELEREALRSDGSLSAPPLALKVSLLRLLKHLSQVLSAPSSPFSSAQEYQGWAL